MPRFGKASMKKLRELDERLQKVLLTGINYVDFMIVCGYRGRAEQNRAYELGNSRLRFPDSGHNKKPSMAVDIAPWYKKKPHVRWELNEDWYRVVWFVRGVAAAKGIKLKPIISWDYGHIELDE